MPFTAFEVHFIIVGGLFGLVTGSCITLGSYIVRGLVGPHLPQGMR